MVVGRVPLRFGPTDVADWLALHAELVAADEAGIEPEPEAPLEPAGLVLLASLAAARKAAGKDTGVAGDGADAHRFLELEPIADLRTARRLAHDLADSLERTLPNAAHSVVRATRFVLEELGANIVQHSARPETGFGALQAWPERNDGRFQLAFSDAGVGFLASLSRHAEFAILIRDDGDAVQLAVEKGLSGVGGRSNMGMGLGLLLDLSDRLGADLWIVSGTALWHRRTAARDHRIGSIRLVPRYEGAWICLDAPAFPR